MVSKVHVARAFRVLVVAKYVYVIRYHQYLDSS